MIELSALTKVYRSPDVETTALRAIDLLIGAGEFVAVMGPSGCGKSTLLNIIGLLDTPSGGRYRFAGTDVTGLPEAKAAALRKAHIGFIFQSFNLIDELSVAENVEVALLYHDVPGAERRRRVREALDRVGITHRADHLPQQLSGGQQQRVAIARATVAAPKVLLADEPTGNLDSANGEDVMELLTGLNAQGATIVMVTHSPLHAEYARRTINLFDGQIVSESIKSV